MTNETRRNVVGTPVETPDPRAAGQNPAGRDQDRPGLDLGGAKGEKTGIGSGTIPGGPKGSAATGSGAVGRAAGYSDPSGSRPLGTDSGSEAGSGPTEPR